MCVFGGRGASYVTTRVPLFAAPGVDRAMDTFETDGRLACHLSGCKNPPPLRCCSARVVLREGALPEGTEHRH